MMLPFAVVVVACLAAAAYVLFEHRLSPRRVPAASLERAARYGRRPEDRPAAAGPRFTVSFAPLARLTLRLLPRVSEEKVAMRLAAAGVAHRISPEQFLAAKPLAALLGIALGVFFGAATGGVGPAVTFALLFGFALFVAPDAMLRSRTRRRRERILAELPNALDLLAVSLEAGLGFDAAIARFATTADGPLAEELGLVVAELRVGASREEVLRRLAKRVRAQELSTFVRAVLQAEELGMSLTKMLRAHANDVRIKRQAAAEERAGKMPVKMLFPTVLFIFPPLFVVVLGPAVLYLLRSF